MNEVIWLIPQGDDILWCEDPDPSPDIDASESIKYIREDAVLKRFEARIKELEKAVSDLIDTFADELGLDFVMGNNKSIDKACALLAENHEFKSKENDVDY